MISFLFSNAKLQQQSRFNFHELLTRILYFVTMQLKKAIQPYFIIIPTINPQNNVKTYY